jgi:hypothetical protein
MASTTRYGIHNALLNTAGGTSLYISGCRSYVATYNVIAQMLSASSEYQTQMVTIMEAGHSIQLDTWDLTVLSTVGMTGVYISPGSATPGLTIWGRLWPQGGVPGAIGTGEHVQYQVSDGMMVPVSVKAEQGKPALLSTLIQPILGNTATYSNAAPLLETTGATITTGSPATANVYTLGPVAFWTGATAHTLVTGLASTAFTPGIGLQFFRSDGDEYYTEISINKTDTTFEFTTSDLTIEQIVGDGLSVLEFAMFYRKMQAGGTVVAPATASHVSVVCGSSANSVTAGVVTPATMSVNHPTPGAAGFKFTPNSVSGTLVTIGTSSTIPTS